jgi:hypothetical protein
MRTILLLLLVCIAGNVIAQGLPKAPVIKDKKVKSVTKYGVGYDKAGIHTKKNIISYLGYNENGYCTALDMYYTTKNYDPVSDVPLESEYDFRGKQSVINSKWRYTYNTKAQLTNIDYTDTGFSKSTTVSTFNDKEEESIIVYKTNTLSTTAYKKYDAAGNLISTRTYENGELTDVDSTAYNSKNQRIFDYRWDENHQDFIYYTYNKIDSIASQYWLVTGAANPSRKDTSNIILYKYDDKNRHVETIEYINLPDMKDLYYIGYQYNDNGSYTVWFRHNGKDYLSKWYDAQGKGIKQIDNTREKTISSTAPANVMSKITKYYYNEYGLLDHVDIFNSEDRLIDKEVYEYGYW